MEIQWRYNQRTRIVGRQGVAQPQKIWFLSMHRSAVFSIAAAALPGASTQHAWHHYLHSADAQ